MHPLAAIRDELNMSRWGLSMRSGIKEQDLQRYEAGQGILLARERQALVKALFDARVEQAKSRGADRQMSRVRRELATLNERMRS